MEPARGDGAWQRRVIVVVDLVESVRLMLDDEPGTIRRWMRFLGEVRAGTLLRNGGRFVKSTGDGMMLEFESASEAVAAAFEMHRLLARQNAADPGPALQLRTGIHLADILVDGLDVYGSGVNLAARLATLANPGEIIGSVEVRDALTDGITVRLVDLGDCYLKHIAAPVRAFRLEDAEAGIPVQAGVRDPHGLDVTVAIVPFSPVGDATPQWAFGDAIADVINDRLARCPGVRVISRLSTGAMRRLSDVPAACRQHLQASFVFHGTFAMDAEHASIRAELCDTRDGTVRWAGHVRSDITGVFIGQDAAFESMASDVCAAIVATELSRARGLSLPSLAAFSLYVGGVGLLHRMRLSDFARSRTVFEALHEREPRRAAPLAMLAKWHLLRTLQGWSDDPREEGLEARARARQALSLDPDDGLALAVDALLASHFDGDLDAARRRGEQAVEADPQETMGWLALAGVHSYEGRGQEAIDAARQAIARSPVDPKRFMFDLLLAAGMLAAGRAADAAELANASLRQNALHAPTHRLLVIALSMCGDGAAARRAAQRLLALDPSFNLRTFMTRYPGRHHPHATHYVQALADAGVPA